MKKKKSIHSLEMSVLCVCSKDKTKTVIKYEEVLERFAPSQEAL